MNAGECPRSVVWRRTHERTKLETQKTKRRSPLMKFLLIVVLLAAAGSLAQGDAVVNAWLKKHGLSEYADELEELGAESREDLDYLEEGGA